MNPSFFAEGQSTALSDSVKPFSEMTKENFKKHPYQCQALVSYFLASAEAELGRAPLWVQGEDPERECVSVSAHGLFFAMMAALRVLEDCAGALPTLRFVYAKGGAPAIRMEAEADSEGLRRFASAQGTFGELDTMARAAGFSVLPLRRENTVSVELILKRYRASDFSVFQPISVPMAEVLRSAIDWADR